MNKIKRKQIFWNQTQNILKTGYVVYFFEISWVSHSVLVKNTRVTASILELLFIKNTKAWKAGDSDIKL